MLQNTKWNNDIDLCIKSYLKSRRGNIMNETTQINEKLSVIIHTIEIIQ